jgi:DNA (cytosine-5)-methyltransferase 1
MGYVCTNRPKLLDLFCGAGGAGYGYWQAGFSVEGVDIREQKNYPFRFHLGDALAYVAEHGQKYDAIHASPPCQAYTKARKLQGNDHPDLIPATRAALQATGKPYIIENVPGAPLLDPIVLVGTMFGLGTMRPRCFECSFDVPFVLAPAQPARNAKMGRPPEDGEFMHVVGHVSNVPAARIAMGIPWMTQHELAQAIPPAYTQWIGSFLWRIFMRLA